MRESKRERIKLAANYQNGMAVAVFAVGAFGPFWNNRPRNADEMFPGGLMNLSFFILMMLISLAIHMRGRDQLNELDDDKGAPSDRESAKRVEWALIFYGVGVAAVIMAYHLLTR